MVGAHHLEVYFGIASEDIANHEGKTRKIEPKRCRLFPN